MKRSILAVLTVLPPVTVLATSGADACVLADRLRIVAPQLTEEQIRQIAHHPGPRETIPYSLAAAAPCVGGMADVFPCKNVDLLAFFSPSDLGGSAGNDLWGWTDPKTQKEYALLGLDNGTAFVDLGDPENPVYLGRLPSHNGRSSSWRDVAVYGDHAYVVADHVDDHGLQVFDLTQLRDVTEPPVVFSETAHYGGFERAHNVASDEVSGFVYVVGSDTCSGGLHILDVREPASPVPAGCYSGDGYTHDVQCLIYQGPDVEHQGKEVCFASNEDTLTIVDVTDKSSPMLLSRQGYEGSGYVHQGWLTEDQRFFLVDDEADERMHGHNTRTYTWDVTDLDMPVLNGHWDAAGPSIDHNQYVKGDYTFQANYRRGLRVLRIDDPTTGRMSEVAYLDTWPADDTNLFGGAWSSYPFFASGIVLISDISRGLFIVRPMLPDPVFEDDFESGDTADWTGGD
jgi:choice-of-anchor B domain-containing protein